MAVRIAAAIAFIGLFAGCASDDHPVIHIENLTPITLRITFLNALRQEGGLVDSLPPHQTAVLDVFPSGADRCTPRVR